MKHPWRMLTILLLALAATACGSSDSESSGSDGVDLAASTTTEPAAEDLEELLSDAGDAVDPAETTTTTTPVVDAELALDVDIFEANARLGRGINIGNSLDAPREGAWGVGLEAEYFDIIADAGFGHVRLPISWAGYANTEAPYLIPDGDDPTIDHPDYRSIWERVDWAIDQAEAAGLNIIVNVHHYDAIHDDPRAEEARFLAMWEQIADRYVDAGEHVYFELLNEPNTTFDNEPELWNDLAAKSLAIVREQHPTRPVLVGPVGYNAIDRLDDLVLPDDPNIISTVHVYEPFDFTHQGATWVDPVRPLGTRWEPDSPALPLGVYNYSWDTETGPVGDQYRVAYDRQWAGFSLDYQQGVAPTSVSMSVAGPAEIRVICRTPDGELEVDSLSISGDPADYEADLSTCPAESTGVSLQNSGTNNAVLLFDSLVICSDRGCEEMLATADGAMNGLLDQAAAWADAQGVPMHMGEFGAFGAEGQVPLTDRAAWTKSAADAAASRGMSFAYWEFHAGFGAYDLTTNDWIPELRDALVG